jgi:hypothetical protein
MVDENRKSEDLPHHGPKVCFKIDCDDIEVRTDRLKVRELLDLVHVNPDDHYLVKLGNPENCELKDLNEVVELHDDEEFITVFTGPTPVS